MSTAKDIRTLDEETQKLIETIAYNCDVADAQNAHENTMCIYLLKMRDYYRWTHRLPLNAQLPKDKLGKWINVKEKQWESLFDKDFQNLNINNQEYDPFDVGSINDALKEKKLHYSAGFGRGGQVHFHLGAEHSFLTNRDEGIFVTSAEYARDLTAAPAHSIDGNIFLRQEALLHYIWAKYEEWSWKKPDNAMAQAINCYDFVTDPVSAAEQMGNREIYATLLHEKGEIAAGNLLTEKWEEMLAEIANTRAEILVRATRDHLADCLVTLPTLIEAENWPSIHFYFANLEGFRKQLWPELVDLYKRALKANDLQDLNDYIQNDALPNWRSRTKNILEIASQNPDKLHHQITEYFAKNCGV
ncbi:MAG: hypothetical protein R3240_02290 [Gammaproteobacteria bacterium]|nr:hypothetical protein [Gammaproteobacteria bacterium]